MPSLVPLYHVLSLSRTQCYLLLPLLTCLLPLPLLLLPCRQLSSRWLLQVTCCAVAPTPSLLPGFRPLLQPRSVPPAPTSIAAELSLPPPRTLRNYRAPLRSWSLLQPLSSGSPPSPLVRSQPPQPPAAILSFQLLRTCMLFFFTVTWNLIRKT